MAEERLMIIGTEGNPDYLVCARKNGYVLGIKPLLQCSMDRTVWGFRLRLQKADTGQDIANKQADMDGMTKVFAAIPWQKRSSKRFSTVVMQEIAWGVEFTSNIMDEIKGALPEMIGEVADKFAADESFIDPEDMQDFLMEAYVTQAEGMLAQYNEYLAAQSGSTEGDESPEGLVVAFPVSDSDVED